MLKLQGVTKTFNSGTVNEKKALRETWIQFIREAKKERSEIEKEPLQDEITRNDFSSILTEKRGNENDKEN